MMELRPSVKASVSFLGFEHSGPKFAHHTEQSLPGDLSNTVLVTRIMWVHVYLYMLRHFLHQCLFNVLDLCKPEVLRERQSDGVVAQVKQGAVTACKIAGSSYRDRNSIIIKGLQKAEYVVCGHWSL